MHGTLHSLAISAISLILLLCSYEEATQDIDEVDEILDGFDKEAYIEAEKEIFATMNYCLYLPESDEQPPINPKASKTARQ